MNKCSNCGEPNSDDRNRCILCGVVLPGCVASIGDLNQETKATVLEDDGGPAFPTGDAFESPLPATLGMTLRDHFASLALCVNIKGLPLAFSHLTNKEVGDMSKEQMDAIFAERAYALADALLAERNKQK